MSNITSKICLIIGMLSVMTALYLDYSHNSSFSISEEKAQTLINKRLQENPLLLDKYGVRIFARDVRVDFIKSETAKTEVMAVYQASGYGLDGNGSIKLEAKLHYESGHVFLRNLRVIEHQFKLEDAKHVESMKSVAKNALDRLGSFIGEVADQSELFANRDMLKSVSSRYMATVKTQSVHVAVEMIQKTPVYKLRETDIRGRIAAMSVESLETDDNAVYVKLQLKDVLSTTMFYVVAGVAFFMSIIGFSLSRR